jgi:hypothetical protein
VHRDTTARDNPFAVTYTFREGVPQSLLQRATPWEQFVRQPFDLGFYAQDKWTVTPLRLTLNLGIRFDYFRMYNQADTLEPGLLVPNRNISIPETPLINFKDISPRVAAAFDLFGSGKTALKVGLNKYMGVLGPQLNYMNGILTPIEALANTATRSWNDRLYGIGDPRTGNYVPDCDLTANAANGECGIVSNTNFGRSELVYSQTSDPRTATGFGNRPYQWEVSAGVQHALTPRVSVDAGYFRRWRRNFTVVDNFALSPADFSPYSVTAPTDPRLPESGNVVGPFFDINPNVVSLPPVNVNMPASDYGKQTQGWQGMDLTLNARLGQGVVVQGGFSTGRASSNNCAVLAKVPEADRVGQPFCDRLGDWESQLKFLGTYLIPKIDVQIAGTLQSLPIAVLAANYVVSNAVVRESLGRDLSAGVQSVTVPLLEPGSLFGEIMNQLDLRFSKVLTFGHTRNTFSLDINNALNNNAVLSENTTYQNPTPTGWRVPTSILTARFFRLSYQLNF